MENTVQKPINELGSLKKLGFHSLSDCLLVVPKDYRDFTNPITNIKNGSFEEKQAYLLKFISYVMYDENRQTTRKLRDCFRLSMTFRDVEENNVYVSIFGGVFAWKDVIFSKEPIECLLWGLHEEFNGNSQIKNAELMHTSLKGKILPVYVGKVGQVSAAKVSEGVYKARDLTEEAAMTLVSRVGLRDAEFTKFTGLNARDFLDTLHHPKTMEEAFLVKQMSSKIASLALVQSAVDYRAKTPNPKASIKITGESISTLVSGLPFALTNDQTKAIQMIVQGLREPFPTLDLISADVGVGKSITFMIPAVAAALSGVHVGIMAPTMLLAEQLYNEMREYFPQVDIGLVQPAGKIHNRISVGTTALIGAAKRSKIEFSLAIVDEQHKFGTDQRASLIAAHTNLIESTATPIPRSIALVAYGGYRLIHMTECPVVKKIATRVVLPENKSKAFDFIKQVVSEGGQVAVVYRGVESTEESAGNNVKDAASRWEKIFPSRVGVIHGKLEDHEKAEAITAMKEKRNDVLVSSSIIEVGITLPSLKAIVVMEADYFGLAQLHQLRGRVARKGGNGYCFLFPSKDCDDDAIERLRIMEQCTDGYVIAERDMENRGFGNLDGDSESQHGKTHTVLWNAKVDAKSIEDMADNLDKILASVR